jgi:hypothetical protein
MCWTLTEGVAFLSLSDMLTRVVFNSVANQYQVVLLKLLDSAYFEEFENSELGSITLSSPVLTFYRTLFHDLSSKAINRLKQSDPAATQGMTEQAMSPETEALVVMLQLLGLLTEKLISSQREWLVEEHLLEDCISTYTVYTFPIHF